MNERMEPQSPPDRPVYGPTNLAPAERDTAKPRRFASIVELRPEKERYYRELHAEVWPAILKRLADSNVRNYSIYVAGIEGRRYLVSYLEYVGEDYEADMKAIAEDAETRRWWLETDPCQKPLPQCGEGQWWLPLEEVFHTP